MESLELVILEGEQAGARTRLIPGSKVSISASLDSDIVLRDLQVGTSKVQLCLDEAQSRLSVLAGEVEVAGDMIFEGEETPVPAYTAVKIGGTTFAYGLQNDPQWRTIIKTREEAPEEYSSVRRSLYGISKSQSRYAVFVNKFVFLVVLSFFLLVGSVFYASWVRGYENAKVPTISIDHYAKDAMAKIRELGFIDLEVESGDSNSLVVSGYLDSISQYTQLENVLGHLPMMIELDVQVGEQLAAEVQNVYRVNNVDAEVKIHAPHVVKAYTSENDTNKLDQVKLVALRDISNLDNILVKNVKKPAETSSNSVAITDDPGKRVAMIVPGESGYIVTVDESRYFVGSLFPTGHLITRISGKQVLLEKEGVKTTLSF